MTGHGHDSDIPVPSALASLPALVVDAACGHRHSVFACCDGNVYTVGTGEYGRLGHGDELSTLWPEQVAALPRQIEESWADIQWPLPHEATTLQAYAQL